MQDYEKLGAFYLGKKYDLGKKKLLDEQILYDSKDLNTHAIIIGMTGSGKTGLGIGLLEEAAMDNIPVIAIDPKGDLGNVLLTFPRLSATDFKPWVNAKEAQKKGKSVDEFAKAQAELWRNGLGDWGQDKERIKRLRETVDMAIYTPGSTSGLPISVLSSFKAPGDALKADRDAYRERVQATATSILALLDMNADPLTSREHILIANILEHNWEMGRDLDIAGLINAIQSPPLERVGVMDLESFYPSKQRFALAMQLNNLLAAPGFEAWMEGESLSADTLLYTDEGQPRLSVMSIAHLSDSERMFFVSMLLNEIISWMRSQPGSSSLRAILYMDEIFGYIPPTANPASKVLFLTLLKQARAYGVGLVLATQNPVDLDYKGLANTGTWFIGRMQTERDKARVMDGLEGASTAGNFDRGAMEQTIASLGKRVFLLHNVHEAEPVVFTTRWVMSYLAGPLTRAQIKTLMGKKRPTAEKSASVGKKKTKSAKKPKTASLPAVSPDIDQYFVPPLEQDQEIVYEPMVIGSADVGYSSARYKVNDEKRFCYIVEPSGGAVALDWDDCEPLEIDLDDLELEPLEEAGFGDLDTELTTVKNYRSWEKLFKRWLRSTAIISLYKSAELKEISKSGESERDFRIRLQQIASEQRDAQVEKLRKRYATKITTLENRLQRAEQRIEREVEQSKQKKLDTVVAVGSAILGAFLGRKRFSRTSTSKVGTAVKTAGRMRKEAADVEHAQETAAAVKQQLEELNTEFEQEVARLENAYDAQIEELEVIDIKPKSTEIHIHFVGLAWLPYQKDEKNRLRPAW